MLSPGPRFFLFLFLAAAAIALVCGSNTPHTLQSVTVTPATASGEAQFTATGYFTSMPSPVTPLQAIWGACIKTATTEQPTTAVTVSTNGLAQCVSGASGTFTVWASSWNSATCNVITPCNGGCAAITGTAQLTCP